MPLADNLNPTAGTGPIPIRFLSDGVAEWAASVVCFAPTISAGANVLQPVNAANPLPITIDGQSGTVTVAVSGSVAVTGTFWQATQPVSVASLPALPNHQSTNVDQIGGSALALGQALAAASLPVVLTAAQITTLTPPAAITGFALEAGHLANIDAHITACNTGAVNIAASAAGGCTMFTAVSAGSNNEQQVKGSAGTVKSIVVVNTTSTIYYLKLFDGTPTMGTTSANWNIPIPANTSGAGVAIPLPPEGLQFSTNICIALTGAIALADNTNAATGVAINIGYK